MKGISDYFVYMFVLCKAIFEYNVGRGNLITCASCIRTHSRDIYQKCISGKWKHHLSNGFILWILWTKDQEYFSSLPCLLISFQVHRPSLESIHEGPNGCQSAPKFILVSYLYFSFHSLPLKLSHPNSFVKPSKMCVCMRVCVHTLPIHVKETERDRKRKRESWTHG